MLSAEQIKKLISANESLQIQLEDANAVLASREQEIEFLNNELADATDLRSKLDGQQDEIESMHNRLGQKQQAAKGAEERELELYQELTEMAVLNKHYNELLQDYAYLQSQYKDVQAQLTAVNERNFQLLEIADQMGALQSKLENSLLERDNLANRVALLESQKYLRDINL